VAAWHGNGHENHPSVKKHKHAGASLWHRPNNLTSLDPRDPGCIVGLRQEASDVRSDVQQSETRVIGLEDRKGMESRNKRHSSGDTRDQKVNDVRPLNIFSMKVLSKGTLSSDTSFEVTAEKEAVQKRKRKDVH